MPDDESKSEEDKSVTKDENQQYNSEGNNSGTADKEVGDNISIERDDSQLSASPSSSTEATTPSDIHNIHATALPPATPHMFMDFQKKTPALDIEKEGTAVFSKLRLSSCDRCVIKNRCPAYERRGTCRLEQQLYNDLKAQFSSSVQLKGTRAAEREIILDRLIMKIIRQRRLELLISEGDPKSYKELYPVIAEVDREITDILDVLKSSGSAVKVESKDEGLKAILNEISQQYTEQMDDLVQSAIDRIEILIGGLKDNAEKTQKEYNANIQQILEEAKAHISLVKDAKKDADNAVNEVERKKEDIQQKLDLFVTEVENVRDNVIEQINSQMRSMAAITEDFAKKAEKAAEAAAEKAARSAVEKAISSGIISAEGVKAAQSQVQDKKNIETPASEKTQTKSASATQEGVKTEGSKDKGASPPPPTLRILSVKMDKEKLPDSVEGEVDELAREIEEELGDEEKGEEHQDLPPPEDMMSDKKVPAQEGKGGVPGSTSKGEEGVRTCPSCGKEIWDESWVDCPFCGEEFVSVKVQSEEIGVKEDKRDTALKEKLEEYKRLGNEAYNEERYEDAILYYDKAIEIDPTYERAWYNKGDSYRALGEFEKALECYDEVIKLNPKMAGPWANKGVSLSSLGRFEEAIETCDKAIELNPDYVPAWFTKGLALACLNKYDDAIECYNTALDLNPDYTAAWFNKGTALFSLNKFNEALECYKKTVEINPDYIAAWFNMAQTYEKLGRKKEAIDAYNKAIELNPGHETAKKARDRLLGS